MAAVKKKPAADDAQPLLETSSGGGPVLLLPVELGSAWTGARGRDYERAGEPDGHVQTKRGGVGWLPVGSGTAIVLSEELATAWLPTPEGGVVVRGPDASDMSAGEARKKLPKDGWKTVIPALELHDGRVVLFDSAAAGSADPMAIDADPQPIVVEVGAGTYEVTRAHKGMLDFVRLVRTASREATPGPKPVTPRRPPPAPPPVAPVWDVRALAFDAVSAPIQRAVPLAVPVLGLDEMIFGRDLERDRFVRAEPSGAMVPISEPGAPHQLELSADRRSLYFFGGSSAVLEVPATGTTREGVVRFEAPRPIASLATVSSDRVVLSYGRAVHLMDITRSPWRVVSTLELGSRWDPSLMVVDEGPFVWADADPHIHFAAIFIDRLQLVQTTLRTKGGIQVHARRAFVFGRKYDQEMHHEITNLRAVHDALK